MGAHTSFRILLLFGSLLVSLAQWPGRSRGRPGEPCGAPPMALNLGPFVPNVGRRGSSSTGLSMMQAMVLEQLDMTELALLQMAFPGAIVPQRRLPRFRPPPPRRPPREFGPPPRPPRFPGPPPPSEPPSPPEGRPPLFPAPPRVPPPPPRNAPRRRAGPLPRPRRPQPDVFPAPPGPPLDIFARPPALPKPNPPRRRMPPPPGPRAFAPIPAVSIETVPFKPPIKARPGQSPLPVFPSARRKEFPEPPRSPRPQPPFLPPPRRPGPPPPPPEARPPPPGPPFPPGPPGPTGPPGPAPYAPRPPPFRRPPAPYPRASSPAFNPYMAFMLEGLDIPDPLLPFVFQSAVSQVGGCYCTSAAACGRGFGHPAYGHADRCDGRFNLVCCCQG